MIDYRHNLHTAEAEVDSYDGSQQTAISTGVSRKGWVCWSKAMCPPMDRPSLTLGFRRIGTHVGGLAAA